jgi:hypothetical protein
MVPGIFVAPGDLNQAMDTIDTRGSRRGVLLTAAAFFSMGAAILVVTGRWFLQAVYLLVWGRRVQGTFLAVSKPSLAVRMFLYLGRVVYEFVDHTGSVRRGSRLIFSWRLWRQAQQLGPGSSLDVLFDPKNPVRNTMVPPPKRGRLV